MLKVKKTFSLSNLFYVSKYSFYWILTIYHSMYQNRKYTLLMYTGIWWCLILNHLHDWIANQTSSFLHGTPVLPERTTDKPWLFYVTGHLAALSQEIKWACHFKENSWQYFLPISNLRFQVQIRILEHLCLPPW
jgi:hypothetical protein